MAYRRLEPGRRDQEVPDRRLAPPPVQNLGLAEERRTGDDGQRYLGIQVSAEVPTWFNGEFEVWWQIADESTTGRWTYGGRTREFPFLLSDPGFIGEPARAAPTIRVAVVAISFWGASIGPEGSPQAEITLDGTGNLPENVNDFTVAVDHGELLFTWTPVPDRRDILGYEIRAGTGWLSASIVGVFAPWGRGWAAVPRVKAPGLDFLIKALTRSGDYSETPDAAALAAAGGACLDVDAMVEPSEQTIPAGLREVVVTTVCPYDAAPYFTFGSANPSTAPQKKRIVGYNTSDYAQNIDDTWSFTLRADARAPASGGWLVHLHGAGA